MEKDNNNPKQYSNLIIKVPIEDEMAKSYIDYAMSVIVSRALPDVRDGLKPVQRRILYAMYKENILPNSKFSKSMGVVGEVMKKYHPHGDSSVYDALARMVQYWVMRYPLIEGQGNFGTVDGDLPAAPRYTECRLTKISLHFLEDLEKSTVDFVPNYTGEYPEPTVLPVRIPNLLLNGADGIAVGMATKIPPHNLGEVIDALIYLIKQRQSNNIELNSNFKFSIYAASNYLEALNYDIASKQIPYPKFEVSVTTDELMKFIKGPDFPTGAAIYGVDDIRLAYETGKGKILMQAIAQILTDNKGKEQIIVTQLPYQVNKAKLAERIYELHKEGKIEGIADIRDESNSNEGIRLVIDLKKGFSGKVLLNKLYKLTEMRLAYHCNMVAIVDKEPRTLSLKEILEQFLRFQYEILIRASIYELNENIKRIHILEGLKIALDNIDEIISIIKSSKNVELAKESLIQKFSFSEFQAQAILDMQLRRLAALERQKIEDEYNEVNHKITETKNLLDSRLLMEEKIVKYLTEIKKKYSDDRRTMVFPNYPDEINQKDLVHKEKIVISFSNLGFVKRMKEQEFKLQKRGGKGSLGAPIKGNDYVRHFVYCDTHSQLLVFTNKGKVYSLFAYQIPEMTRKSRGTSIANFLNLDKEEKITSILVRDLEENFTFDIDQLQEDEVFKSDNSKTLFLFMATRKGLVKKIPLNQFREIRKTGLICISLEYNDELIYVRPTDGKSDIILVTSNGKLVRFREDQVSPTSRNSKGVKGIKLEKDNFVVSLDVVRTQEDRILFITDKGFAKITKLSDFPTKNRGIKGITCYKLSPKTGNLILARVLDHPNKELIVISQKGISIRLKLDEIKLMNRNTTGLIIFRIDEDDKVSSCALI
ncbi:MAG: DNA gyrase subunit A [candidate division WOR-3 bacterium]